MRALPTPRDWKRNRWRFYYQLSPPYEPETGNGGSTGFQFLTRDKFLLSADYLSKEPVGILTHSKALPGRTGGTNQVLKSIQSKTHSLLVSSDTTVNGKLLLNYFLCPLPLHYRAGGWANLKTRLSPDGWKVRMSSRDLSNDK